MNVKQVHETAVEYLLVLRPGAESGFDADRFVSDMRRLGFRDDDTEACTVCGLDSGMPDDSCCAKDVQVIGNALLTFVNAVINVPGGKYILVGVYDTVATLLAWLAGCSGGMESCGIYRFCHVVFSDFGGRYAYLVPDGMTVHPGDRVNVPAGPSDIKSAVVVSAGEYMDFASPVPVQSAVEICRDQDSCR